MVKKIAPFRDCRGEMKLENGFLPAIGALTRQQCGRPFLHPQAFTEGCRKIALGAGCDSGGCIGGDDSSCTGMYAIFDAWPDDRRAQACRLSNSLKPQRLHGGLGSQSRCSGLWRWREWEGVSSISPSVVSASCNMLIPSTSALLNNEEEWRKHFATDVVTINKFDQ